METQKRNLHTCLKSLVSRLPQKSWREEENLAKPTANTMLPGEPLEQLFTLGEQKSPRQLTKVQMTRLAYIMDCIPMSVTKLLRNTCKESASEFGGKASGASEPHHY